MEDINQTSLGARTLLLAKRYSQEHLDYVISRVESSRNFYLEMKTALDQIVSDGKFTEAVYNSFIVHIDKNRQDVARFKMENAEIVAILEQVSRYYNNYEETIDELAKLLNNSYIGSLRGKSIIEVRRAVQRGDFEPDEIIEDLIRPPSREPSGGKSIKRKSNKRKSIKRKSNKILTNKKNRKTKNKYTK
ncbi:MAG: hypothetical protein WD512_18640 [Candidatus Paceibacterota bacterium]